MRGVEVRLGVTRRGELRETCETVAPASLAMLAVSSRGDGAARELGRAKLHLLFALLLMLLGTTLYRALLREAAALPDTASRCATRLCPPCASTDAAAPPSAYYRLRIQSHFRREPTPESSLAGALREKAAQKVRSSAPSSGTELTGDWCSSCESFRQRMMGTFTPSCACWRRRTAVGDLSSTAFST